MAMSPVRIRPKTALEAAGYIRVSRKEQAEGHSPEIQRQAIKKLAAQEGYAPRPCGSRKAHPCPI
jgi:hypothetical protein